MVLSLCVHRYTFVLRLCEHRVCVCWYPALLVKVMTVGWEKHDRVAFFRYEFVHQIGARIRNDCIVQLDVVAYRARQALGVQRHLSEHAVRLQGAPNGPPASSRVSTGFTAPNDGIRI